MNDATPAKIEETGANEVNDHSRRSMLRSVALGIGAAGAAALVTNGRPALAADGGAVTMGQTNEFDTATNVNYKGATTAASFNVQSGDETTGNNTILNNNFNGAGAALLGVASGNGNQAIGIVGWSKKANGTGVIGFTGAPARTAASSSVALPSCGCGREAQRRSR